MNGKSFTDTLKEVQSRELPANWTRRPDQLAPDLMDLDGTYQAHAALQQVGPVHPLPLGQGGRAVVPVRPSQTRTASSAPGTTGKSSWYGSPG